MELGWRREGGSVSAAKKLTGFAVVLAAIFGVSFGAGQMVGLFPLLKTASSDVHPETHDGTSSETNNRDKHDANHDVHPTAVGTAPGRTDGPGPTTKGRSNSPVVAEPTATGKPVPAASPSDEDTAQLAPVTTAFTVRAPQQSK